MSIQYAPLSEFALLKIEGEDSLTFLQGQLSQDITAIKAETALLASYSNPKGRVFATLLMWQDNTTPSVYYALVTADNASFLQKRLSMFILRSKVKISLVEAQPTGIWSDDTQSLNQAFPEASAVLQEVVNPKEKPHFIVTSNDKHYMIRYPSADNTVRLLSIQLAEITLPTNNLVFNSSLVWQQQDILTALPWVSEKTREVFVAQSINQDAIGAINFKKGCYPGQEVIARSHYLGNLKRRTLIATVDTSINDISSLLASDVLDGENPIGQVVNAVSIDGKTYLLVEVQLRSVEENARITLAVLPEMALTIQQAPYSLEKPE